MMQPGYFHEMGCSQPFIKGVGKTCRHQQREVSYMPTNMPCRACNALVNSAFIKHLPMKLKSHSKDAELLGGPLVLIAEILRDN